jgi:hypothetical protein
MLGACQADEGRIDGQELYPAMTTTDGQSKQYRIGDVRLPRYTLNCSSSGFRFRMLCWWLMAMTALEPTAGTVPLSPDCCIWDCIKPVVR